ncbi:MAG: hypothetical protein GY953_24980, partial [bacterium]|nr:hypothetical protein [bacterium]
KESVLEPRDDTTSSWNLTSPETAGDFSAVCYLFGKELHQRLDVPVGLIAASWGGTNAEEWTTPEFLRKDADFAPILERWRQTPESTKELYEQPLEFDLWFDDFTLLPVDGSQPEKPLPDFDGRVSGKLKVSDTKALRGEFAPEGAPVDLSAFRGVRFNVRGKGFFKVHSLQPDITDSDNYASRSMAATGERQPVTVLFEDLRQAGWGLQRAFDPTALRGLMIECLTGLKRAARPPGGLYNGMIAPVIPYAIRG